MFTDMTDREIEQDLHSRILEIKRDNFFKTGMLLSMSEQRMVTSKEIKDYIKCGIEYNHIDLLFNPTYSEEINKQNKRPNRFIVNLQCFLYRLLNKRPIDKQD